MKRYSKLIAAIVGSAVAFATAYGMDFSPEMQAMATTALTSILVYVVPNDA